MHVSRYMAPFSQQYLMSAMLETSTDTLSRKSPRPSNGFSTRRKFSRVSGSFTTLMPYCFGFLGAAVIRGDDGDAFGCDADVPQHERQGALPDAAEADENDPAGELNVYGVICHDAPGSSEARCPRA